MIDIYIYIHEDEYEEKKKWRTEKMTKELFVDSEVGKKKNDEIE